MYLVDTNHCSRLIEQDPQVVRAFVNVQATSCFISTIVQGELVFMAMFSARPATNLLRVNSLVSGLAVVPIDAAVANRYGELKAALLNHYGPKERARRRRTTVQDIGVSDNDLWIAATALEYNLIVVSADTDFSRIQAVAPLQLESWV